MPNWRFDSYCVSADLAKQVAEKFSVPLRAVHKPRTGPTTAMQLLLTCTSSNWHWSGDLSRAALRRHSRFSAEKTGSQCPVCRVWKWLPVSEDEVPTIAGALNSTADLIASPEWFGDGRAAFRHVAFRRGLAELLHGASPRNWDIRELQLA
jgi:hypothetical protein